MGNSNQQGEHGQSSSRRPQLLNKYPWLAAVAWYLAVFLLGLIVYPIIRYLSARTWLTAVTLSAAFQDC